MTILLRTLLAASLLCCACGRLPEGPSEPTPTPDPGTVAPAPTSVPPPGNTPVLGSPSTAPTPTPEPGNPPAEGPTTEPDTTPANPASFGCADPVPPAISRINVRVHSRGSEFWTLDSTPLVGPSPEYCARIGYTDGRTFCPVRPEGHPEREGCEAWAVGTAADTGRAGPTWTRNGARCAGRASGCENSPENQYQVRAFLAGIFQACASSGVCGETSVDR